MIVTECDLINHLIYRFQSWGLKRINSTLERSRIFPTYILLDEAVKKWMDGDKTLDRIVLKKSELSSEHKIIF